MFDDPKKELRRLEEALLAEEGYEEYDTEAWEEDSDDDREFHEPLRYNAAVDFGRTLYDDEEFFEEDAVLADTRSRRQIRRDAKKEKRKLHQEKKNQKRKKKGIGGLLLLSLLEILGILWILRWWIEWLT